MWPNPHETADSIIFTEEILNGKLRLLCSVTKRQQQVNILTEYSNKIGGSTPAGNKTLDTEVVVPLKYLSNVWRFLDLLLINCEIELDLSWLKDCVICEISRTPEVPANPGGNPLTDRVSSPQNNWMNSSKSV